MEKTIILVKNKLDQLSLIVSELEKFAESENLDAAALFNINLAVEELFTNIVFYAYSDKDEHTIILRLSKNNNKVTIEIEDDGIEFNPLNYSEPDHIDKPLEEREIGGLGIHFVRKIMETIDYNRENNKNILTLTYKTV